MISAKERAQRCGEIWGLRSWSALEAGLWRHPEWWSLTISAAAWVVLVTRELAQPAEHHGPSPTWLQEIVTWVLMVLAMMLPLVIFSIRVTAARSLWRRRDRAIGGFVIGYLGPWLLAGVCIASLDVTLNIEVPTWLAGVGFGVAAVWQLTPIKQRALRACHRTIPLAPHGWRADRDCLRFGWLIGGHCLVGCWVLMASCVLAEHNLAAMLCATAISLAERYVVRPRQRPLFSPLLGVALVFGILGLSG